MVIHCSFNLFLAIDFEYLFVCFSAICKSSWENYLLLSFAHYFFIRVVFLLVSSENSLCILDTRPVPDV